jgi:cbb3-type cytochrome oxidase subunit 3
MSRLMGELFKDSPLLLWPLVSLTIFVLTFLAVAVYAFLRRPQEIADVSALPLVDDAGGTQ